MKRSQYDFHALFADHPSDMIGFYIQALLYDIDFSQHEDKESYRKELEQLAKEKGKEYLYEIT